MLNISTIFNKRYHTFSPKCLVFFLAINILWLSVSLDAQIIPTAGETECFIAGDGGVFLDPGGEENYPNCGCETVTTLCSPDGGPITITFTEFDVFATFDFVEIYEGDTLTGTVLYDNGAGGANAGDNLLSDMIASNGSASFTSPDGCITILFFATTVVDRPGWSLDVSADAGHPGDGLPCGTNLDCLPPGGVEIAAIGSDSALVTWAPSDSAMSYAIEYGLQGFMPGDGVYIPTSDTSAVLAPLNEETTYEFYVSILCTNGDTSNLNGPFEFTTPDICPDFSDVSIDSVGAELALISWVASLASGTYEIEFDTAGFTPGTGMVVTTTEPFIELTGLTEETDYDFYITLQCDNGDSTGQSQVFSFTTIDLCPDFSNVVIDSVAVFEAFINWLPSVANGDYEIEIDTAGFEPGTGNLLTTTDSFYVFTNLEEFTEYDFYIQLACFNGDTATTLGPFNFTTEALNDVGISGIRRPNPDSACDLSSTEIVEVEIKNFGILPQTLIPFKYSVNEMDAGVPIPTDGVFTGVISNDSIAVIEFETTYDFSQPGQYLIKAWTEKMPDVNPANDTFVYVLETAVGLPLVEDFESGVFPEGWETTGGLIYAPGSHTAPSFVWAENVWSAVPYTDLTTPRFGPVGESDTLTFDYRFVNYFAGTVPTLLGNGDVLRVEVSNNCGETFSPVFAITQDNHDPTTDMTNVAVVLDQFEGQALNIRFVGEWGTGDYWLDLDNININGCPVSFGINGQVTDESVLGAADGGISISTVFGAPPLEYFWADTLPNASTLVDLPSGEYTVIVTDSFGCQDMATFVVDFLTAEAQVLGATTMELRPNPARQYTDLILEFDRPVDVEVQLMTMMGSVVEQYERKQITRDVHAFDLSQLPPGLYAVRILVGDQMKVEKLIKIE